MVENENQILPDITAPVEAEPVEQVAWKRKPRAKKAAVGKSRAKEVVQAKPKTRGLGEKEKLDRIAKIEAMVTDGAMLKDAVKEIGISDQTYYQWKKAVAEKPSDEAPTVSLADDDEFAEFRELEAENRRLRKLLAEKLRSENADLRKRLGLK